MQKFLEQVYVMEKREYEKRKKKVIVDECQHDTIDEKGNIICVTCGCILGVQMEAEDYETQRPYCMKRVYKKVLYLKKVIQKLSGYFFREKRDVNLDEMPESIRGIRKYIANHKLHKLNDIYYWRLKNNVTIRITYDDQADMINKFKQNTKSIKNFIYDYLLDKPKYVQLLPLVEKKEKKILTV